MALADASGIVLGLAAGLIAVTLTESIGAEYMPWGRWPWTIHSAGWGILVNFGIAIIVSAMTQNRELLEHRMTYHRFLKEHAGLPEEKRGLIPDRLADYAYLVLLRYRPRRGSRELDLR